MADSNLPISACNPSSAIQSWLNQSNDCIWTPVPPSSTTEQQHAWQGLAPPAASSALRGSYYAETQSEVFGVSYALVTACTPDWSQQGLSLLGEATLQPLAHTRSSSGRATATAAALPAPAMPSFHQKQLAGVMASSSTAWAGAAQQTVPSVQQLLVETPPEAASTQQPWQQQLVQQQACLQQLRPLASATQQQQQQQQQEPVGHALLAVLNPLEAVLWQQRQHSRALLDRALHALTSLQSDVDHLLVASKAGQHQQQPPLPHLQQQQQSQEQRQQQPPLPHLQQPSQEQQQQQSPLPHLQQQSQEQQRQQRSEQPESQPGLQAQLQLGSVLGSSKHTPNLQHCLQEAGVSSWGIAAGSDSAGAMHADATAPALQLADSPHLAPYPTQQPQQQPSQQQEGCGASAASTALAAAPAAAASAGDTSDDFEAELLRAEAAAPGRRLSEETLQQYTQLLWHSSIDDVKTQDDTAEAAAAAAEAAETAAAAAAEPNGEPGSDPGAGVPAVLSPTTAGSGCGSTNGSGVGALAGSCRGQADPPEPHQEGSVCAGKAVALEPEAAAAVQQQQQQQQHAGAGLRPVDSFEQQLLALEATAPGRRQLSAAALVDAAAAEAWAGGAGFTVPSATSPLVADAADAAADAAAGAGGDSTDSTAGPQRGRRQPQPHSMPDSPAAEAAVVSSPSGSSIASSEQGSLQMPQEQQPDRHVAFSLPASEEVQGERQGSPTTGARESQPPPPATGTQAAPDNLQQQQACTAPGGSSSSSTNVLAAAQATDAVVRSFSSSSSSASRPLDVHPEEEGRADDCCGSAAAPTVGWSGNSSDGCVQLPGQKAGGSSSSSSIKPQFELSADPGSVCGSSRSDSSLPAAGSAAGSQDSGRSSQQGNTVSAAGTGAQPGQAPAASAAAVGTEAAETAPAAGAGGSGAQRLQLRLERPDSSGGLRACGSSGSIGCLGSFHGTPTADTAASAAAKPRVAAAVQDDGGSIAGSSEQGEQLSVSASVRSSGGTDSLIEGAGSGDFEAMLRAQEASARAAAGGAAGSGRQQDEPDRWWSEDGATAAAAGGGSDDRGAGNAVAVAAGSAGAGAGSLHGSSVDGGSSNSPEIDPKEALARGSQPTPQLQLQQTPSVSAAAGAAARSSGSGSSNALVGRVGNGLTSRGSSGTSSGTLSASPLRPAVDDAVPVLNLGQAGSVGALTSGLPLSPAAATAVTCASLSHDQAAGTAATAAARTRRYEQQPLLLQGAGPPAAAAAFAAGDGDGDGAAVGHAAATEGTPGDPVGADALGAEAPKKAAGHNANSSSSHLPTQPQQQAPEHQQPKQRRQQQQQHMPTWSGSRHLAAAAGVQAAGLQASRSASSSCSVGSSSSSSSSDVSLEHSAQAAPAAAAVGAGADTRIAMSQQQHGQLEQEQQQQPSEPEQLPGVQGATCALQPLTGNCNVAVPDSKTLGQWGRPSVASLSHSGSSSSSSSSSTSSKSSTSSRGGKTHTDGQAGSGPQQQQAATVQAGAGAYTPSQEDTAPQRGQRLVQQVQPCQGAAAGQQQRLHSSAIRVLQSPAGAAGVQSASQAGCGAAAAVQSGPGKQPCDRHQQRCWQQLQQQQGPPPPPQQQQQGTPQQQQQQQGPHVCSDCSQQACWPQPGADCARVALCGGCVGCPACAGSQQAAAAHVDGSGAGCGNFADGAEWSAAAGCQVCGTGAQHIADHAAGAVGAQQPLLGLQRQEQVTGAVWPAGGDGGCECEGCGTGSFAAGKLLCEVQHQDRADGRGCQQEQQDSSPLRCVGAFQQLQQEQQQQQQQCAQQLHQQQEEEEEREEAETGGPFPEHACSPCADATFVYDALDSGCCSSRLHSHGWECAAHPDSSMLTDLLPVQQQQQQQQALAFGQQPHGLSHHPHQQQQQGQRWAAEPGLRSGKVRDVRGKQGGSPLTLRHPHLEQQLLATGTQVQRLQQKAAAGGSAEEALQGTVAAQLQQWRLLRQQQEQQEWQAACVAAITSSGCVHRKRRRKQGAALSCTLPGELLEHSAADSCSHFWGGSDRLVSYQTTAAASATAGMGCRSRRAAAGGRLRHPCSAGAGAALLPTTLAGNGDRRTKGGLWSPQIHSRTAVAMAPADGACQWHAASRSLAGACGSSSSSSGGGRWLLQAALQECRQEAWEQQVLAAKAVGLAAEAQVVSAAIRCTAGLLL